MSYRSYIEEVYQKIITAHPAETEYHRAAAEVFRSVRPVIERYEDRYRRDAVLERLAEPERVISFRVPWRDDSGNIRVNRGWRVQFSGALGPYKGGLRFNREVTCQSLKAAAFEQTLKNALSGFPVGGAKGGSDFDRRGKSAEEVMAFCQSYMEEMYRHVRGTGDILTADFGAGITEIGYLFGEYRRLCGAHDGKITGKALSFGGIPVRPAAAGYGLAYILEAMLAHVQIPMEGKTAVLSGSGKMALHAAEKLTELGVRVVALSDENGYLYDKNGIRPDVIRQIKTVVRESFTGSIRAYEMLVPGSVYKEYAESGIWSIPCDFALPCAAKHEMTSKDIRMLEKNGCLAIAEGALEPLTEEARLLLRKTKIRYMPGKAASIGGVVLSNLEVCQNREKRNWTKETAEQELCCRMSQVFHDCAEAAAEYGMAGDYLAGADITAFEKVTEAMLAQGV